MEILSPGEPNYKELKLTLIVELLISSSNEEEIRTLFGEFFIRLREAFLDRCHKIVQKRCGNFPDWEAIRDDIFQLSFIAAMTEIKDFKSKRHWDDKECEKVLLFWLAQIANFKLLRFIKLDGQEKVNIEKYKAYLLSENSSGSIGTRKYLPTYDKVKFSQIWNKMNSMSKEILAACWDHETLSEENLKHLPEDIIEGLIKKYGVSKAAIRKAKSRAIESIKSCKIAK